ncbi:MAG: ribosome maturation factor RimP [Nitrospiraceae bacterium]
MGAPNVWGQRESRAGRESLDVAERVRAIAEPIVRALDLELVDVECYGQGARMLLRVFVDKSGGVSLGECEQVHLSLGRALDVEDPVPHSYTLEVSSPGLDRPLKRRESYERAVGKLVNLKLRRASNGQWYVKGRLLETNERGVAISVGRSDPGRTVNLEWEEIAEGRLEVEF